ncbi:MAG TPA: hypothetical protein PK711_10665 [Bacteroidales bacterium]|nr:hypothetical protein [Bacteroidales bacterium]
MINDPVTDLPLEQQICVTCGLCCDGTLFWHASLQPGEKGDLPEKIKKAYRKSEDEESFMLPCGYFAGKCTIYAQKRAHVCASYRCQLLRDFADRKIPQADALEIIRKAMIMRTDLMEQFGALTGKEQKRSFRELLLELGKVQKSLTGIDMVSLRYDVLMARCNIFEALLIKYFRSASDFNDLMTSEPAEFTANQTNPVKCTPPLHPSPASRGGDGGGVNG